MRGPHIKQDERIYGATLLDVTPTVLTLFGLPVGEDMDGRVLVQAFDEPPSVQRIPSWEEVPGECGMHPADLRMDPAAAQAVLQQFVALGYIQKPNENQEKAMETAVREANYNLSRVYLDSRRPKDALPLLQELVKGSDEARFRQHLAQCHYMLGERQEAKRILEDLIANPPKPPEPPKAADQAPGAEAPLAAAGRNGDARAENVVGAMEATGAPAHLDVRPLGGETRAPDPGEGVASPDSLEPATPRPWADWLMGVIQFEEGNTDEALACLLRAEQADPRLPNLHLRIGETYLRRRQLEDAERAFRRALEIDGDSAEAHLGLAQVLLRKRLNEDAADESLVAVGLQHFLPLGHYCLGVALARLGHPHRAAVAFETSVSMLPGLVNGHRWLAALYARPGGDLEKATAHRQIAADLLKRRREQMKAVAN
jgi:tetratricopeptide (TPR) repeat protein